MKKLNHIFRIIFILAAIALALILPGLMLFGQAPFPIENVDIKGGTMTNIVLQNVIISNTIPAQSEFGTLKVGTLVATNAFIINATNESLTQITATNAIQVGNNLDVEQEIMRFNTGHATNPGIWYMPDLLGLPGVHGMTFKDGGNEELATAVISPSNSYVFSISAGHSNSSYFVAGSDFPVHTEAVIMAKGGLTNGQYDNGIYWLFGTNISDRVPVFEFHVLDESTNVTKAHVKADWVLLDGTNTVVSSNLQVLANARIAQQLFATGRVNLLGGSIASASTTNTFNGRVEIYDGLILSNRTTAPSSSDTGRVSFINNVLYVFDSTRGKYLSVAVRSYTWGRGGAAQNNAYLQGAGDTLYGPGVANASTITRMIFRSESAPGTSKSYEIRTNDVTLFTLSVGATNYARTNLNIDVIETSRLRIFSGTAVGGQPTEAVITLELKERP